MKAVFLSKSFRDGEGISEHIKSIAESLVNEGHEAHIVSFDDGTYYSIDERVEVTRMPLHFEGDNLYNWSLMMNNQLKEKAVSLLEEEEFDLVHANDWTTIPAGVAVSKKAEKPLALTLHSTENERGFDGEHSEMISELEWQGGYESELIFVTRDETRNSAIFDLDVPDEKIEQINPFNDGWEGTVLNRYKGIIGNKKEVKH